MVDTVVGVGGVIAAVAGSVVVLPVLPLKNELSGYDDDVLIGVCAGE